MTNDFTFCLPVSRAMRANLLEMFNLASTLPLKLTLFGHKASVYHIVSKDDDNVIITGHFEDLNRGGIDKLISFPLAS